jgi:hypothetical protein
LLEKAVIQYAKQAVDFDTALRAIKEYDQLTQGVRDLGGGSKSFWMRLKKYGWYHRQ